MNDDLIKSDNWKTSDTKALISELRNSLSVQALPASGIGKSILNHISKDLLLRLENGIHPHLFQPQHFLVILLSNQLKYLVPPALLIW